MREKLKAALMRLRELAAKVSPRVASLVSIRDVLCFGGLGCLAYGFWQIYPPAGWIVPGALLFWLSTWRANGPA